MHHDLEPEGMTMKRILALALAGTLALSASQSAFAFDRDGGRFHGDHDGFGPGLLAGAVIGALTLPWLLSPPPQQTVVVPAAPAYVPPATYAPPVAYWCGNPAGYYPAVQSCYVPWQTVPTGAPQY